MLLATPGVHEYLTNGCIISEIVNLHIEERGKKFFLLKKHYYHIFITYTHFLYLNIIYFRI